MIPQDVASVLQELFGHTVQTLGSDSWQVESGHLRLLVLISDDRTWLRSLVSIAPASEAHPYLEQLLEANFDATQETRYALHQGVLWGVYQHSLEGLTEADWRGAIARLLTLQQQGLADRFNQLAETQIRQIIQAAKQQGQSLEATMQTLDRLYQEGVMGDVDLNSEERHRILAAWRYQLERLWVEE